MSAALQPVVPRPAQAHHILLDTTTGDRGMHDDASGPGGSTTMDCGRYSARCWHVVTTGPRAEDLAAAAISALGFEAYLPKVRVPLRQHSILAPLFPGYLFARFSTATPTWAAICRARGVEAVLTGAGTTMPATMPDAAVSALRAHCDASQVITSDVRPDLIAAGVPVQITEGLMIDQRGICLWSNHHRVRLMLDVMGLVVTVRREAVREVVA